MSKLFKLISVLAIIGLVASPVFALEIDMGRQPTRAKGLDILIRNASPATLTSGDIVCWAASDDLVSVTIPSHDAYAQALKASTENVSGDPLFAGVVLETISSDDTQGTYDEPGSGNWGLIRVQGICMARWDRNTASRRAGTPVMIAGGRNLNYTDPANADAGGGIQPDAVLTSGSCDSYLTTNDAGVGNGMPISYLTTGIASSDVLTDWRRVGVLVRPTTKESDDRVIVYLF